MAIIKAKAGGSVSLGSFGNGYPRKSSWGEDISIVDPGVPLLDYSPNETDPLTIWKTQPSVRKVVGFAARQFALVPWHAYQRVGDTDRRRMSGSPAEQLLGNPLGNGLMSGYQLWTALVTDLMLHDLCLAIYSETDGLVRIPPALVRVKSDHWGTPRGIVLVAPQGQEDLDVTLAPKIVTWGWHAHKAGGVTPMKTLANILDENLRAVQWRADQWRNSAKITGLLKRPATERAWRTEQRERFEKQWAEWKNSHKAGGTPILEGMEYQELKGMNPKDAQDIEGRRLSDVEVASAFHIPPELVGAREGTYASVEAFRQMLYGPTLGPLFEQLQQALAIGGILRAVDTTANLYVEPNREAAMAGSFMEQARVLQTLVGRPIMTAAEGRGRLNLPHMDGTDELVTPLNVTEGGLASPTDTGEQNVGGDNADPEAREDQP